MVKLMKFKLVFFILSTLVILPGLLFLLTSGLKLGIDFTGGALLEYKFEKKVNLEDLKKYGAVSDAKGSDYIIRTKPLEQSELNNIKKELANKYGKIDVRREENVGPVIGNELKQKAVTGIILACVMIVLYITYSFRKVPKPASSFRFGVAAIVALLHDVLVVVGLFAIFGKLLNVEVDTLFVTALLTVIGFSVHDTIVVFDRIRENLNKGAYQTFDETINNSVMQTIGRSLNTSLTVILVLLAVLLFGGTSIRWFVLALLVGIISGTYSSIFNAAPLLTVWQDLADRKRK